MYISIMKHLFLALIGTALISCETRTEKIYIKDPCMYDCGIVLRKDSIPDSLYVYIQNDCSQNVIKWNSTRYFYNTSEKGDTVCMQAHW